MSLSVWASRSRILLIVVLWLGRCEPVGAQDWSVEQDVDPARVIGHQQCAKCHQSELSAWSQSHHAMESYALLSKPEAGEITKKLGIPQATQDQRCTTCHETQRHGGGLKAVSCESCHSHAGPQGRGGWIDVHHDLGPGLNPPPTWSDRSRETVQHFTSRMQACGGLGMRKSENLYRLARNCFECHAVGNETLVNLGGHPAGKVGKEGIEFLAWSQGEVRHNFLADPASNAEAATAWLAARTGEARTVETHKRLMFVVGQIALLEVGLRNRARATQRGNFLDAANKRILGAKATLAKITTRVQIDELDSVVAITKTLKRTTLRKLHPQDPATYGEMADMVAFAGHAVSNSDATHWQKIDRLLPRRYKGDVFQP